MCDNCKNELNLISFKWDNEENMIIYKYQCKKCGELKTKCGILSDRQLKDMLINEEMYNNFNI